MNNRNIKYFFYRIGHMLCDKVTTKTLNIKNKIIKNKIIYFFKLLLYYSF